jgi:hypothetical protein
MDKQINLKISFLKQRNYYKKIYLILVNIIVRISLILKLRDLSRFFAVRKIFTKHPF